MSDPSQPGPRALVVFESMFGNTEVIARAVADGLERAGHEVVLAAVDDPTVPTGPIDVDLVVAGAPTHAFSLSRPSTRADAVRQGAPAAKQVRGLREWLADVAPTAAHPVRLVAFDTRVQKVRALPMAAGPRASRIARQRGFDVALRPASFLVSDTPGPLLDGEAERAASWAADVLGSLIPRPHSDPARP